MLHVSKKAGDGILHICEDSANHLDHTHYVPSHSNYVQLRNQNFFDNTKISSPPLDFTYGKYFAQREEALLRTHETKQ